MQDKIEPIDIVPKKTIHEILRSELYDKLKARPCPSGDIELYDPETNRTLIIMHKYASLDEACTYLFDEVQTTYGTIYLSQQSKAKTMGGPDKLAISYSEKWADLLCFYIMEGRSLRDISKLPNMPPFTTIFEWRRRFPELESKMLAAYEARAEWQRDEAYDQSRAMLEDESTDWQKRAKHVDHLMNFAAKDNPKRYSSKVEIHNTSPPVILKLETGVRIPEVLSENLRQVKEITGENSQEILKELEKRDVE